MTLRPTRLLLAALLNLGLLGCRSSDAEPARGAAAGGGERSTSIADAEPVELPRRIISQTLLSDEVLWDLGEDVRARVAGISRLADDPGFSTLVDRWPRDVPRVGGEAEAMLAHEPDFVIVASFNSLETTAMLDKAHVVTLELDQFSNFADYRTNVATIAERVGAPAEGRRVIADFDRGLARVRSDRTGGARPSAISWDQGGIAGRNTTFGDACEHAGLENAAAAQGYDGHGKIDTETLLSWDPDIVFIPCRQGDCESVASAFAEQPGVSRMRAARNGHVVAVPSALLYATGSALVDLTEQIGPGGRSSRGKLT